MWNIGDRLSRLYINAANTSSAASSTLRHEKEISSNTNTVQMFPPIHRWPEGWQSQQQTHHQNQHKTTKFSTIFKRNTVKLYIIFTHNTLWIVIGALNSHHLSNSKLNNKYTYRESPPIISSTAKPLFEPSQTITRRQRRLHFGNQSESQFAQSQKLLGWKALSKSFIVSLVPQRRNRRRTKTPTEKTKRDCRALGDTSYIYLHLLSLLFLATVLEGSSLSVDFTTATTQYPTWCSAQSSAVRGACWPRRCRAIQKKTWKSEAWGSLPGWCGAVKEGDNGTNSAAHPGCCYSRISPNSAATLESFPFAVFKQAKNSSNGEQKHWAEDQGLWVNFYKMDWNQQN